MKLHFSPRRLLLPCLLLPLLIGQSAAGDDLTEAKEISISIRLHQQWENYDTGGNYRETGEFTVTIRGTIAPMAAGKQRKDYMIFEPKSMKATASFNNKWIDKKTGRIDDTETGDGAVDIVPVSAVGQPSEQGHFLLQAFRDRLARVRVAQMMGNTDPMAMLEIMKSKQNQDNYRFNVTVPLKTRATKRGERMRGLHFVLDCARLADSALTGSVSWTSKKRKPALLYRRFPAALIRPAQAEGTVTQSVSWQIGEVPPQIVLFRHVKDQWQQVGQDDTADVLIGRRVRLKAEVHGAKGAATAGAWSIPGAAITDWRGSLAKSELTSLNPRQTEVRFVWVDGDVAGAARVVSYSATVGGQLLSAKTRFKIFSPTVTLKVDGPKSVEAALATQDRPGAQSKVSLYPYNEKIRAGLYAKASAAMPKSAFAGQAHLLQWVQLVKENNWCCRNRIGGQSEWERSVSDDWSAAEFKYCDEKYPYGGAPSDWMRDTPAVDLDKLTVEAYGEHRFAVYLMFLPSGQKDDPTCVWVPVKKFTWRWRGACRRKGEIQLDRKPMRMAFETDPASKVAAYTEPVDCHDHPSWSGDISSTRWKPADEKAFAANSHKRYPYQKPK